MAWDDVLEVDGTAGVHGGQGLKGVQAPEDHIARHGAGDEQQVRETQASDGSIELQSLQTLTR